MVRTDRGLWAVADGMGGHDAGDVASASISDALLRLPVIYNLDELVDRAISALNGINQDLIALATDRNQQMIGSTVVGLAVADGRYRCFWAGDSRAYRVRGDHIIQLTRDHSLVQDLVDAGMLHSDEAHNHPNSNVVTRAIGVADDLQIEVANGDADLGDIFLLATDGLTKVVGDMELLTELNSGDPAQVADRLIETVLARGAPDNVSIIIVKLI